jgi:hypothetical protein
MELLILFKISLLRLDKNIYFINFMKSNIGNKKIHVINLKENSNNKISCSIF